jgi:nucleotide-binding universal stress UspA family protein
MAQGRGQGGRIVVGVDGSRPSRAALRWALQQAELTGGEVEAVIAWQYPVMTAGYAWAPVSAMDGPDFEEFAAKELAEVLAEEVDPATDVQVRSSVVQGHPAHVLLAAAQDAALLVVGSRGHGGFGGMLLGSVSHQCAHHARCPIAIVRDKPH